MAKQFLRICAVALALTPCLTSCASARTVDLGQVEKELTTTGAEGWIHGDVPDRNLFVFTVRDPKDFFTAAQLSLVPSDAAILATLRSLNRHDKVRIKGKFLQNPSPQKHILVTSIETIQPYKSDYGTWPYSYEAAVPDELQGQTHATFLVHAIAGDGHILVVEYKDAILPIFVRNRKLTKDLYRNDVVELHFAIQAKPHKPTHLMLEEMAPEPLKRVDSIHDKNGKAAAVEGTLVLFPKSPEIKFNVFAVQEELGNGLKRQYTLVNFDHPEVFDKVREDLQKAWDATPGQYVNGRNKLLSTKLRIRATGTFSEIDPTQANPQIVVPSQDSVKILE